MITFKQYLIEAINLTIEKDRVKQLMMEAVHRVMKFRFDCVVEEIEDGNDITKMSRVCSFIRGDLHIELEHTIIKHIMSVYNKDPYNVRTFTFTEQLGADGDCKGSNIRIHEKFVSTVEQILLEQLQAYSGYPFIDEESGEFNKEPLWDAFQEYKENNLVSDAIDKIVNIFVHELVHVKQHQPQGKRLVDKGNTEYRSYLTKNKKRFNQDVNTFATKLDWQIYHGSPQEIDAFAHNMAMELIDMATFNRNMEYINDPAMLAELEGMLNGVQEAMKHREFRGNTTYEDKYKEFNDPKNQQHYKVYKRFMKKVYLQVQQYTEKLKSKIQKYRNAPEDWFMDDKF